MKQQCILRGSVLKMCPKSLRDSGILKAYLEVEFFEWNIYLKEIPVNIAVVVLCVFHILAYNICALHISVLSTTTKCLSKKTLKQSSQLKNSHWYTYIINLKRSDTCYISSLYKSSIVRSVRLYILIYVSRVCYIFYFILILTISQQTGCVERVARWEIHNSRRENLKRKRNGKPRLWEDKVYLKIQIWQGKHWIKLGRYILRVP